MALSQGLFRKQTTVVGEGCRALRGLGCLLPPGRGQRCQSQVSWFSPTVSKFSAPVCANTQGPRLAHCMEMRCSMTAFPKEYVFLFCNDQGFSGGKGEEGWDVVGLHSLVHSHHITLKAKVVPGFREVLELTTGSLLGFIASSV